MAKAEPKTQKTKASVAAFIAAVEDEQRRKDAKAVDKIFREVSGEAPAMWGPSIVGYGAYEGQTGTWMRTGFSPRKANLVLYISPDFTGREALLKKLGKHKTGVSCVYVNKLSDLDEGALRTLIATSLKATKAKYG